MPSSLALVVLAPIAAATAIVTCLFILVFVINYDSVGRPFLDFFTKKGGGWVGGLIRWVSRPVVSRIENFVKEHVAALRRLLLANSTPLVIALDQTAEMVQRVAGTLADMSEQTFRALWTLNNETIPRKITAALVPVRQQLTRHTNRLDQLEDLNRRVAVELGDTLRGLPWGVPGGYVTNFAAFLNGYAQLWAHYWNVTRGQLNTLLQDTVPELRRDLADLARRLDVGIDARLDALRNDLSDLQRQAANVILPRLDNLEAAVEALSREVFGEIGTGLLALIGRVAELERWREAIVEPALDALRAELAQLRTELEQGIETGLEAFRARLEAIELELFTTLPQRLSAMQTAIDTLAAEIFEDVGAGLTALTTRLEAVELEIGTIILPAIERIEAELETLRQTITGDIIPRIRNLEGLLEPAAFGLLVLAALRIAAPNLFCRNVTDVTRRICATDEDFFAQLLAGTLLFAIALDPRVIARAGQEVTQGMAAIWRETALR